MFWNKEKKTKIYRVTYRVRNGSLPLIAEILIKTKKDQPEVDFTEAIKKYWEKNTMPMIFEEIIMIDKVGEE